MNIRLEIQGEGDLEHLHVGDDAELRISGRIFEITDEQIDVTPMGSDKPQYIQGERIIRLIGATYTTADP